MAAMFYYYLTIQLMWEIYIYVRGLQNVKE